MVFAEKNISIATEVNAKNQTYKGEEAWKVIAGADIVHVASGQQCIAFSPSTADKDVLLKKLTGPTGNLRAPTVKIGNVFYVGYNAALYDRLGQGGGSVDFL
jgi:hypothetical protein